MFSQDNLSSRGNVNNIEQHWPVLLQQYTMAREFSDNRVKKQQINRKVVTGVPGRWL